MTTTAPPVHVTQQDVELAREISAMETALAVPGISAADRASAEHAIELTEDELDARWTAVLAAGFWASAWGQPRFDGMWPIDARVGTWLCVPVADGGLGRDLNGETAFRSLVAAAFDAWPERAEATRA